MVDSTIQVPPDSTGKKVQTYQNTVGANVVEAEAHVQVDTAGAPVPLGTVASPVRTDPIGTTTQPISDAAGSVTVDAPVATPVAVRQSDGAAFIAPLLEGTFTGRINTQGQKAMAASTPVVIASDQSAVVTRFDGVVSTANSSTTALGASMAFTGTGEDISDYAHVGVFVFADQDSAIDGLSLEYSTNNTNWDDTDKYTIVASSGRFISVPAEAQFFRVVYTNGGTAQAVFRLQTIYKYTRSKPSSHRIADSELTSPENDAELVLAIPAGIPQVKFQRVNATADGDNVIIAAVAGKKIRVLSYVVTVTVAGTMTMQDTQATPAIHAQFSLAAQGGASYPGNQSNPAFETAAGFGVEINNPAGVDTLGHMTYQEV